MFAGLIRPPGRMFDTPVPEGQWQLVGDSAVVKKSYTSEMQQPPVDREDHSGTEKVRVLVFELAGDILVGLQSPDPVVGAAIQLIQLSDKHNKS